MYFGIEVNNGEHFYKCSASGKSFLLAGNLKAHIKILIGEKLYNYTMCSKSFLLAKNLKVYKRTHTRECPCNCSIYYKSCWHPQTFSMLEQKQMLNFF